MIVFPMAGLSQRFTQKGYTLPKYMLPLWGGTVFDFAVSSFQPSFEARPFLFIYRETGGVKAFLTERAAALGIRRALFAELVAPTAGQAETVEMGLAVSGTPPETPLTIFNIDTFRNPKSSPLPVAAGLAGWLEVFTGAGDNWSFVRPQRGEPGIVAQTAEKIPISDLCCTGLYHFATSDLFRAALVMERAHPSARELYVAPIYNHLIKAGHRIGYATVAAEDLVHCGLPHEYEALMPAPQSWKGAA